MTLVLMGGGLTLYAFHQHNADACTQARLAQRPEATRLCAPGNTATHGSGGTFSDVRSSVSAAGNRIAGVVRGGFGSVGAHFSAGS